MGAPRFLIGQLVRHNLFGYRGVVYDADPEFGLSDAWYDQVATSKPPKDAPWYRVLVHGGDGETYVAERHLEADTSAGEIVHPELSRHFDEFKGDHYARTSNVN